MLQHLENNDAILLMYLAGELPEADRLEIDQQLQSDAGLRAALAELQALHDGVTTILSASDGILLPQATESSRASAMTRRISRAMVKQRLEQADHPTQSDAAERRTNWLLRLPRWAYPITAAALILIAFVSYWGFTTGNDSSTGQTADRRGTYNPFEAGLSLPTPPASTGPSDVATAPSEQLQITAEVLPATSYPRAVDDSDRNVIAVSAGAYDVSTLFSTEPESP